MDAGWVRESNVTPEVPEQLASIDLSLILFLQHA